MAEHEVSAYERSLGIMKAHAIVSIIFGILGALLWLGIAVILVILSSVALSQPLSDSELEDAIITLVYGIGMFIFAAVPHIFFIISGIILLRKPAPRVARGLVITNLVLAAMTNLVILILSIINLVQLTDYERGYKKS